MRRYRDGRSAEAEAETLRALAALRYPLPILHAAVSSDLVMERIEGPTLAEAVLAGMAPFEAGATLAGLHDDLHAISWPGAKPDECLLHLDLHPLNVLFRGEAPVVIDWSNARPGAAGLDVAMTALILVQVVVTDGLVMPTYIDGAGLRPVVNELLCSFVQHVQTPYVDHLPAAVALRRLDPHQSAAELADLPRAVACARSHT